MIILYEKDAFCEHCGELEPYTAVVDYEEYGITMCLWCAHADGDITIDKINKAELEEKSHQIKYYKHRIEQLEKELIKLL